MDTKKKRTPNQKKKAIVSVLLMVAILITGAFAFLSATDSKTNVFTVGNVKIKLSEEFDTNQNGSIEKTNDENDEVYDASETQVSLKGEILPGQKVIKRPYVENMGKNKAWVYITVGIPTTNSDNTFRNKDTGETSITGQNVDIPIQAYAIQENYANKTTYKDVWNAYFADKVTDTFGAEVTDAKTLSERVPLFEILNKTRFNEPTPDNISVDDNIPNDDWENIGITVDGQEKSYYKSANYDYYVFAYKTLLDPTADGAEQLSRTSDVFEGVRLLKDIGEAQPSKLNYYIKETAGNTLNGEVDLSVEASTYDGYRLVKTEYYMPGERVRNLYYDDTLAETGYSFNWNFMNDKTKSAYSGMIITEDTDLVATYEDTVSNTPKEPTEVPVIKYSPSGYLGYAIEQNDDGSYYATLIGADETRSDYPEAPTEVLVPNAIKILENSDGTKLLEDGVIMHGSIDNFPGGTQIPVKKIQLAEWQWDSSTMNYAAPEAVALGKIAKKLNISGTNIEEIKFCGDIYQHNITSGFVLEDIGTLPSSLTTLNDKAFYSCINLKSCTFSNRVVSIGDSAFEKCKTLKSISLSDSIASIGKKAFYNCADLNKVNIMSVTTWCNINFGIDNRTDDDAHNVDAYTSNPLHYAHNLYLNDELITDLVIPDNARKINRSAFAFCDNLKSITIGNKVTNIEKDAFWGCKNLSKVHIPNIASWCNIKFSNEYSNPLCYANDLYLNDELVTDLIIPYGVTDISNYTFYNCDSLTSITIPDSVKSIGNCAFKFCYGLTNITIPNSVTNIGASAFANCPRLTSIAMPNNITSIGYGTFLSCGLTSITIPDSVTSIGKSAFQGCTSLTNITIPDSIKSIGERAFEECKKLKQVNISDIALWCNINFDGTYSNPLSWGHNLYLNNELVTDLIIPYGVTDISNYAFEGCWSLTNITIPKSVTSIGNFAFSCRNLTSITIPDSVTRIGNSAFAYCGSLANVTIGHGVKSIGKQAFNYCSNLTSVEIPDSVTEIDGEAFRRCTKLTGITIPNSVNSISLSAFEGCSNLASIDVDKGNENYASKDGILYTQNYSELLIYPTGNKTESLVLPEGLRKISDNAFQNNDYIKTIYIPSTVTEIGKSIIDKNKIEAIVISTDNPKYDSRDNCNAIIEKSTNTLIIGCKNAIIPDGVINIGNDAFSYCTGLTNATIPNGVTSIGNLAFSGCNGLTSISFPDSVTNIGISAFSYCKGLKEITIGNGVTEIGSRAFESCTNLEKVNITDIISWCKIDFGYNPLNFGKLYLNGNLVTNLFIPEGVTSIGSYAFQGYNDLMSVTIPNGVTNIGVGAFWGCRGLTSITIPNTVTDIEYLSFMGCSALTNIIYQGTVSDWAKVNCPPDSMSSGLTITCTDGTVTTQ